MALPGLTIYSEWCSPWGVSMIGALLAGGLVCVVATFPGTWLLMLFLGNTHLGLSYWGTLPLGILVSALLGGVTSTGRWSPPAQQQ